MAKTEEELIDKCLTEANKGICPMCHKGILHKSNNLDYHEKVRNGASFELVVSGERCDNPKCKEEFIDGKWIPIIDDLRERAKNYNELPKSVKQKLKGKIPAPTFS